jgi:hypothetical protein
MSNAIQFNKDVNAAYMLLKYNTCVAEGLLNSLNPMGQRSQFYTKISFLQIFF